MSTTPSGPTSFNWLNNLIKKVNKYNGSALPSLILCSATKRRNMGAQANKRFLVNLSILMFLFLLYYKLYLGFNGE
jgi:hypothetical protein